jgi:hypothetical protein
MTSAHEVLLLHPWATMLPERYGPSRMTSGPRPTGTLTMIFDRRP